MKRLVHIISFWLVFFLIFLQLDNVLYNNRYVSVGWDYVQDKNADQLDVLFVGNSHMFCTVNPIIVNEALGIQTVILGSSSQPMEMALENLKIVVKNNVPKKIFIEANMLLRSMEPLRTGGKEGYILNNVDGISNPFYKIGEITRLLKISDWAEGYSQLFRPTEMWTRYHRNNGSRDNIYGYKLSEKMLSSEFLIEDMEAVYYDTYQSTGEISDTVKENSRYLDLFLQIAQDNNIDIYIIKSPVINEQVEDIVRMMQYVETLQDEYDCIKSVVDFNLRMTELGLSTDDFYDNEHLNRFGAIKVSEYVIGMLGKELNMEPDYSGVCFSRNEYIEVLDDETCRFVVECYHNTKVDFVISDKQGDRMNVETGESDGRFFAYIDSISDIGKISYYIQPKEIRETTAMTEPVLLRVFILPEPA